MRARFLSRSLEPFCRARSPCLAKETQCRSWAWGEKVHACKTGSPCVIIGSFLRVDVAGRECRATGHGGTCRQQFPALLRFCSIPPAGVPRNTESLSTMVLPRSAMPVNLHGFQTGAPSHCLSNPRAGACERVN